MANSPSARKRARQADKRRRHNASLRSAARNAIRKVQRAIEGGSYEEASMAFKAAVPIIDRMTGRGIIPKNRAARHKSRLNAHIKALQS
ncbi:MAG: 30S ribosomal protein S20 [Pseudomonadales bacterium]